MGSGHHRCVHKRLPLNSNQTIRTCGEMQGDAGLRVSETRADAAADSEAGVAAS